MDAYASMTLYLLNLLDLLFTLHAVNNGGVELNPLMQNIPFQIFYKVFVIGVLCWWMSKREEPIARVGLLICTIYYAIIDIYHIINIFGGGFIW